MHQLTLSLDDRKAIDWIGSRYAHGNDLFDVLCEVDESTPPDRDWDHEGDITWDIPEHLAWKIDELGMESEYRFDCFASHLAEKLLRFCTQVV